MIMKKLLVMLVVCMFGLIGCGQATPEEEVAPTTTPIIEEVEEEEVVATPTMTPVISEVEVEVTPTATPFPTPTPVIDEPSGPNYDPNVIAPKTEEEEETTPVVEEVFVDLNNPDYDTLPGAVWFTMEFWLEHTDENNVYCHASYYDAEGNLITGGFWTKSYIQAKEFESFPNNKLRAVTDISDYEKRSKWGDKYYANWTDFLFDFKPVEE